MSRQSNDSLIEAGKRMADIVNALPTFSGPWELRNTWLAFRLEDGGWDGNQYDSMMDAKRHTDPTRVCYFSYRNGFHYSPRECELFIHFHRKGRQAGLPQKDPDSELIAFPSIEQHDAMRLQQMRRDARRN